MKYGHRGANQPVRDLAGARTYITSQNHGYAVAPDSVRCGRVRYENANDRSCEGIDYPDYRAFTVQFHPRGVRRAARHVVSVRPFHGPDGRCAACRWISASARC